MHCEAVSESGSLARRRLRQVSYNWPPSAPIHSLSSSETACTRGPEIHGRGRTSTNVDCGAPQRNPWSASAACRAAQAGGALSWPRRSLSQRSMENEAFARGSQFPPGVQAARLGAPAAQGSSLWRAATLSTGGVDIPSPSRRQWRSASRLAALGALLGPKCSRRVVAVRGSTHPNGVPVPVLGSREACWNLGHLGARADRPARVPSE